MSAYHVMRDDVKIVGIPISTYMRDDIEIVNIR